MLATGAAAQTPAFLADSVKKQLDTMQEKNRFKQYLLLGDDFYGQYTMAGYNKALACYNQALLIAEKNKLKNFEAAAYDCIGGVYDAIGDEPQKIYDYYKKAFDYFYQEKFVPGIIEKAYCMATACERLKDSTGARGYIKILDSTAKTLPDKKARNVYSLAACYALLKNNNVPEAMRAYATVDKSYHYQDSNFAFGRMFAVCSSRWYYENKNYAKAIEIYTKELQNNTSDSALIMEFLAKACAGTGQDKQAYRWMVLVNDFNTRKFNTAEKRDITVGLLKTDNNLLEKDKQLLAARAEANTKQNRLLLAGLCMLAVFTGVSIYFLQLNRRRNRQLARLNQEKETLLSEIHHRVKNNLQMVHSLLDLQEGQTQNQSVQKSLREAKSKVQSIALLHENLYKTDAISVPADLYFTQLVNYLLQNFDKTNEVTIQYSLQPFYLNSAQLVPLALMVNEMVLNSLKYAVKQNVRTTLSLAIEKNGTANKIQMQYSDNGQGLPQHFTLQKNASLGMNLIFMLARQLKADITFKKAPLEYNVSFDA